MTLLMNRFLSPSNSVKIAFSITSNEVDFDKRTLHKDFYFFLRYLHLLLDLLPQATNRRPHRHRPSSVQTVCSSSLCLAATFALPDAYNCTLHCMPATESAEELRVLANFDLLDLFPQTSTVTGAILADNPDLLCAFCLQQMSKSKDIRSMYSKVHCFCSSFAFFELSLDAHTEPATTPIRPKETRSVDIQSPPLLNFHLDEGSPEWNKAETHIHRGIPKESQYFIKAMNHAWTSICRGLVFSGIRPATLCICHKQDRCTASLLRF